MMSLALVNTFLIPWFLYLFLSLPHFHLLWPLYVLISLCSTTMEINHLAVLGHPYSFPTQIHFNVGGIRRTHSVCNIPLVCNTEL